jgi:fatty-acyl-CoA synthase
VSASFSFEPLTPTAFLQRSAAVYSDRSAVVDGDLVWTYGEFADRSRRLTGALAGWAVKPGDRVAALCANTHELLELHHGVPLRGAVLVALNTRLSVPELLHIVRHAGARVLVATADRESAAAEIAAEAGCRLVLAGGLDSEYEQALAAARPQPVDVVDERQLLAINYTSGTTGAPKGVMYHHRGAYLQALAMAFHTRLDMSSRYLWTLPMFHCNGWCFPWAVTAAGGTHVCLPRIDTSEIWALLNSADITHLSGAPTVLAMLAGASEARGLPRPVQITTGGAPPTPALLSQLASLNIHVVHLYGLTETFGPLAINDWRPEWNGLDRDVQAKLRARQGVPNVIAQPLRIIDAAGIDVAADGNSLGEVIARGNDVMLGYFDDPVATAAATTADGWFRTGDLGVMHPDGYVELRDRAKDVIISGGENISSIEVESALASHPAVAECAVVAAPDDRWGEVPIAFVTVRDGCDVTDEALSVHVRAQLASFKVPKLYIYEALPKTGTGKIQKNVLRERARSKVSRVEAYTS